MQLNARSLRQFDTFLKPVSHFKIQTISGAFITLVSTIIIVYLFCGELYNFVTPSTKQEIVVDVSQHGKISIYFDITFPRMPCSAFSVDSMDISGEQQTSITKEINKTRLHLNGSSFKRNDNAQFSNSNDIRKATDYCGSCYGANLKKQSCCNTCNSVLKAFQARGWILHSLSSIEQCRAEGGNLSDVGHEGCRLNGHLGVNKVAGSFHIAPGKSFTQGNMHIHFLQGVSAQFDLSHNIKQLSFGDSFPGQINPLENLNISIPKDSPMILYFLKMVPTVYSRSNGVVRYFVNTYQYSVTWQVRSTPLTGTSDGIPGVFFNYEISPVFVKLTEVHKSLLYFFVNSCAIIGGVLTVAALLDTFIYKTCNMQKKEN